MNRNLNKKNPRTIISHLKPLNTKKNTHMALEIQILA